jgi:hypothetical protein
MPMKKDPNSGDLNADRSKNEKYCSYCYQQGAFTQPDFTAVEMQAFCKEKLKEIGFPGFLAGLFTKGIPRLDRWKA